MNKSFEFIKERMKSLKNDKEGRLMELVPAVAGFIVVGLFTGVAAKVLSDFATTLTNGTDADDAVLNASAGVSNLADYLPLLGTIIILGIIISTLVGAFQYFKS